MDIKQRLVVMCEKMGHPRDVYCIFCEALKAIQTLEKQLDLAHKFHEIAIKERDLERIKNNPIPEWALPHMPAIDYVGDPE